MELAGKFNKVVDKKPLCIKKEFSYFLQNMATVSTP